MAVTAAARQWPLTGRGEALASLHAASVDPALGAVILTGPVGVGKTRLAQEVLALRAQEGARTVWLSCSADSDGPLSPFAQLLPHPDLTASPFGQVRDALEQVADGAALVLGLDDVHHLDQVSAGVLLPIVESGIASLVVTMPDDAGAPAGLDSLWRSGRARAHQVAALDGLAADTLLHRVLGGCVDGRVVADFTEISRGNVLVLRELVRGSLDAGRLVEVDGVWRLSGPPAGTTMLAATVRRRFDVLDDDARSAVEHVAVAGELDLADLLDQHSEQAVEAAEAADLLAAFEVAGSGPRVRIADVLQREVLLEGLGRMRRTRLARAAYELIERRAVLTPEDWLRTAELRLDADGTAPARLLLDAARAAKTVRNLPAVERLCRAALVIGPDPGAAVLLAEVLYERGAFAEADALLTHAAVVDEVGDTARAELSAARAAVIAFGLGRLAEGVDVLTATSAEVADSAARSSLTNRLVMHTLWATGPSGARAVLDRADADLDESAVRSARIMVAALTGQTTRANESVVPGDSELMRLPDAAELLALTEAGALDDAAEHAEHVYRRVATERAPLAQVWVAHALGRTALAQGRPATARRWFQEMYALAREVHQVLPLRLAVAGASTANAWLGDDPAIRRCDELDDAAGLGDVGQLYPAEIAVGRAWRAHARGDLAGAREHLLEGARHAWAIGSPGQAALAAHALARLDWVDDAAQLLIDCAEASDSALVAAYADHARALQHRDPDALEETARRLAGLGARLVAAEAAARAAVLVSSAGDQRRSQALRNLSNAWAGQCEGAVTPGLAGNEGVTISPLTRRERQIAVLVAQGRASREVAEALFLSVRTVDNHLQRVFAKLGVAGRGEVADALRGTGQWMGAA